MNKLGNQMQDVMDHHEDMNEFQSQTSDQMNHMLPILELAMKAKIANEQE